MWLIDVYTRRLQEFVGDRTPSYAILSHTWVDGQEVTFQEMMAAAGRQEEGSVKTGWQKIDRTCLQAARSGLEYVWVDTCCINKTSSAELSEAINSMFQWYKRATVCYVFLPDLTLSAPTLESGKNLRAAIEHCRWFTRSWTLQELIAPLHIHFFNQEWELCFTRDSAAAVLAAITGIDTDILEHKKDLSAVSVAQKMSWAATRESTRIEDASYSLMGIFQINMPLLYGEEERAFLRLQTEIINSYPDPSILAWMLPEDDEEKKAQGGLDQYSGVMASSPILFRDCVDVEKLPDQAVFDFSMSNRGIKLRAQFGLYEMRGGRGSQVILPVCQVGRHVHYIRLRNVGRGSFARQEPSQLTHIKPWDVSHELTLDPYLLKQLATRSLTTSPTQNLILESRKRAMQIVSSPGLEVYRRWPWQQWDDQDQVFFRSEELLDDNLGWAAVKILAVLPASFLSRKNETHDSVDILFYAFGWGADAEGPSQSRPRCTMYQVRGTIEDRGLEQMNQQAINDNWNAYWVANRLVMHGVGEQDCLVAATSETEALLLNYSIRSVEDAAVCLDAFWRVEFGWQVVPIDKVPQIRDGRWLGVDWGAAINPPWKSPWEAAVHRRFGWSMVVGQRRESCEEEI